MIYEPKKSRRMKCVVCRKTVWTKRKDRLYCSAKCCLRAKYIKHKDKILARNKKWIKNHPEKNAEYHRNWLKKNRKKWNKSQAKYQRKKYHKDIEKSRAKGREMYYKLKESEKNGNKKNK